MTIINYFFFYYNLADVLCSVVCHNAMFRDEGIASSQVHLLCLFQQFDTVGYSKFVVDILAVRLDSINA